jgi:hypothetical protein
MLRGGDAVRAQSRGNDGHRRLQPELDRSQSGVEGGTHCAAVTDHPTVVGAGITMGGPDRLLALQSMIGNRSVALVIQRGGEPPEELPEGTHSTVKHPPGSKKVPPATEAGLWAHANFEKLRNVLLKNAENLTSEKLAKNLVREHPVPDGRLPRDRWPRIDRLNRTLGEVIEIKPEHLYEKGLAEAKVKADLMDRFDPLPGGKKWKPRCVTYNQKKVKAYLRRIGYLEARTAKQSKAKTSKAKTSKAKPSKAKPSTARAKSPTAKAKPSTATTEVATKTTPTEQGSPAKSPAPIKKPPAGAHAPESTGSPKPKGAPGSRTVPKSPSSPEPPPRVKPATSEGTVSPQPKASAKTPPVTPRTPIASGPAPRTPTATGLSDAPSPTATPNTTTSRTTGGIPGARTLGTGIKVLGVVGNLRTIEDLRNAFAGLGPQIDLAGLDPADFDVGYVIKGISIGQGYYIDVRVERNIIFRRKFYVIAAYEIA